MSKISGYKTYIVAGIIAAVTFGKIVGWIDEGAFQAIMGILAALGLYTVRSAISKLE